MLTTAKGCLLAALLVSASVSAELSLPLASLLERQQLANQAVLQQNGSLNDILVEQLGQGNVALLQQAGYLNQLALRQIGIGNRAEIEQVGVYNQVDVLQQGDFNLIQIQQLGGSGFSIQQIGNNAELSVVQY